MSKALLFNSTARILGAQAPGHRAQGGFSLIELMVAALIGIVVLGVVASLYIANRKVFQYQESYSRLQETGRYAMEHFGQEIRASAYTSGCGGLATLTNIIAKESGVAPYWWLDTDLLLRGYDDQALTVPVELANAVTGSDILVVKYRATANEMVLVDHDLANKKFRLIGKHVFQKGQVLAATDCARTSVFRMSNTNTIDPDTGLGDTPFIEYSTGAGGSGPDNTSSPLSAVKYSSGGLVSPLVTNAYYVMDSNDPALVDTPDPCPTTDPTFIRRVLVVRTLSGAIDGKLLPPHPVACDVQNVQLRYGMDNDADMSADQFMTAKDVGTDVAAWGKVVSVRVELLVVNPKLNTAEADVSQCLDYNGGGTPQICPSAPNASPGSGYGYVWSGAGRRSAKVFTSTFNVRNRAS